MQPHNPGLSEEAWKKLHRLLAKFEIKYGVTFTNELPEQMKEMKKSG